MSAERLREAARLMREQHGPGHERHAMWAAMADWMGDEAEAYDGAWEHHWFMTARAWDKANNEPMGDKVHAHFRATAHEYAAGQHRHALAVANAYLGGDS